ncbi:TM248-like protein [Mya arenaria]|uniref:TM248-like protein n=1 Tax=Mya arenaria TaxID=6604 RepID=A0ABY7DZF3_MYAAR|nr:TM248-like protein [Mya arenaria]
MAETGAVDEADNSFVGCDRTRFDVICGFATVITPSLTTKDPNGLEPSCAACVVDMVTKYERSRKKEHCKAYMQSAYISARSHNKFTKDKSADNQPVSGVVNGGADDTTDTGAAVVAAANEALINALEAADAVYMGSILMDGRGWVGGMNARVVDGKIDDGGGGGIFMGEGSGNANTGCGESDTGKKKINMKVSETNALSKPVPLFKNSLKSESRLPGADAESEFNVTMKLPFQWNASLCYSKEKCKIVKIKTCLVLEAPNHLFPQSRAPSCSLNESVNSTSDIENQFRMVSKQRSLVRPLDMVCNSMPSFTVDHKLDPKLTIMLSLQDQSAINLHLVHTSYFLFVMVITLLAYASVKGRSHAAHKVKGVHYTEVSHAI